MLVLSRKRDESIIIGDVIEAVIVDIRGDKVRLGIRAPAELSVHRGEVLQAISEDTRPTTVSLDSLPQAGGTVDGPLLVMSRRKNESVVINGNIHVVVIEIRGDKVRLGIESPRDVPPHRREVYEAIKRYDAERKASKPT